MTELWNISAFADSARLIYDNIVDRNDILRGVIKTAAQSSIIELLDRVEFMALIREKGDFAADILESVARRAWETPNCGGDYCLACHQDRNGLCGLCNHGLSIA